MGDEHSITGPFYSGYDGMNFQQSTRMHYCLVSNIQPKTYFEYNSQERHFSSEHFSLEIQQCPNRMWLALNILVMLLLV